MNRNVPEQINLNHKNPFDWEDSDQHEIIVTIFKMKGSFFSVYVEVSPPQEFNSAIADSNKREFGIPYDCKIILRLDTSDNNKEKWRFSQSRSIITTKEWLKPLYGGLSVNNSWEISFYAKYNYREDPDSQASLHKFNINVEIKQENGDKEWLPITIDPDIRNPRPGSREYDISDQTKFDQISVFALKGSV